MDYKEDNIKKILDTFILSDIDIINPSEKVCKELTIFSILFSISFNYISYKIYSYYLVNKKNNNYISRILYLLLYIPVTSYDKYFYFTPIIFYGLNSSFSFLQEPSLIIMDNWRNSKCIKILESAIIKGTMSKGIRDYANKILREIK